MKLLYCPECSSVFNLAQKPKKCACGICGGQYLPDRLNAEYYGPAVVFGIGNASFSRAAAVQSEWDREAKPDALGAPFDAFMIPVNAPTVKKLVAPSEQDSAKKRRK